MNAAAIDPPAVALPRDARQVLLFSGHRVDAPQRTQPRFPLPLAAAVGRRIDEELARLDTDTRDVALSQAAAGGDLLFIDACLRRAVRCIVLLPEAEDRFIEHSVLTSDGGCEWHAKWLALRERLAMPPQTIPAPDAGDRYERCNRWLLDTALQSGADHLRVLCVWDGEAGDGPGGVAQLIDEARRHTDHIVRIDPRALQQPPLSLHTSPR